MKQIDFFVDKVDLFGKQYNFNYQKRWDRFKTAPGAFLTIILFTFVICYIIILL